MRSSYRSTSPFDGEVPFDSGDRLGRRRPGHDGRHQENRSTRRSTGDRPLLHLDNARRMGEDELDGGRGSVSPVAALAVQRPSIRRVLRSSRLRKERLPDVRELHGFVVVERLDRRIDAAPALRPRPEQKRQRFDIRVQRRFHRHRPAVRPLDRAPVDPASIRYLRNPCRSSVALHARDWPNLGDMELAEIYADCRDRLISVGPSLSAEQRAAPLLATPPWVVTDAYRHLTGVCARCPRWAHGRCRIIGVGCEPVGCPTGSVARGGQRSNGCRARRRSTQRSLPLERRCRSWYSTSGRMHRTCAPPPACSAFATRNRSLYSPQPRSGRAGLLERRQNSRGDRRAASLRLPTDRHRRAVTPSKLIKQHRSDSPASSLVSGVTCDHRRIHTLRWSRWKSAMSDGGYPELCDTHFVRCLSDVQPGPTGSDRPAREVD